MAQAVVPMALDKEPLGVAAAPQPQPALGSVASVPVERRRQQRRLDYRTQVFLLEVLGNVFAECYLPAWGSSRVVAVAQFLRDHIDHALSRRLIHHHHFRCIHILFHLKIKKNLIYKNTKIDQMKF